MSNHKRSEADLSRYFDRLFKEYPARSITTQKQLFKWLLEQGDVPVSPGPISKPFFPSPLFPAEMIRWLEKFKALMLGNRTFAPRGFLSQRHLLEMCDGEYLPIASRFHSLIKRVGFQVEREYKLTKAPVEAARLYAIFSMIEYAPKLFDGLQYNDKERRIKSSKHFEQRYRFRVRVDVPQSPAAETALALIESYRRELDED